MYVIFSKQLQIFESISNYKDHLHLVVVKLPDIHASNGVDVSKVHPDSSSANLRQKREN